MSPPKVTTMSARERASVLLREDGLPDFLNRLLNPEGNTTMIRITTNATATRPSIVTLEAAKAAIAAAAPDPLTFACPSCGQASGEWCRSATGKKLPELHSARRKKIACTDIVEAPTPETPAQPEENSMSKLQATTAKNRKEPGSRPAAKAGKDLPKKPDLKATTAGSGPKPKKESKTELVDRLLHAKLGVTKEKLSEATGWPSVNLRVAAGRCPQDVLLVNEGGRYRLMPKAEFDALPSGEAQLWQKVEFKS